MAIGLSVWKVTTFIPRVFVERQIVAAVPVRETRLELVKSIPPI